MIKKNKKAIITKTIIRKGSIGKKRGWTLEKYIKTGEVEFYGDAE